MDNRQNDRSVMMRRLGLTLVGACALALGAVNCQPILGWESVEVGDPGLGGQGGGGAAGGTAGNAGTGGAAGEAGTGGAAGEAGTGGAAGQPGTGGVAGAGGSPECTADTVEDVCPGKMDECQKQTCTSGTCGTDNTAKGTPLTSQDKGDCKTKVCDGKGATTTIVDTTDFADDGSVCTVNACGEDGTPTTTEAAAHTDCTADGTKGGKVCDGHGKCVECVDGTDCTGDDICDPTNNKCGPDACHNKTKDGTETDVDCGGGDCDKCGTDKTCAANTDCESGVCDANKKCKAPACDDHVKNGNEIDVDCGGTTCRACPGAHCDSNSDCASDSCDLSMFTCN